ncbi:unnamed protein product [Cuscuta epithymum]|uniref:DDE Tnp4 domain-containing protein n=1 Tax=Cuscuta epithymum TaxID=186058 RepID=A0AAV0C2X4_9ASTE|nr:unnamed protein product [Cuscuta epithymum]
MSCNSNQPTNNRRRQKVDSVTEHVSGRRVGSGENAEDEKHAVKTREVEQILTSLLLLEEQEKDEQEASYMEYLDDRALLEENLRKRNCATREYLSYVHHNDDAVDLTDGTRKRRVNGNSSAAAAAIAVAAASDDQQTDPTNRGEKTQTVLPQRRLWVKERSQDWWDQCSSPEFPEEEFKRAFRMGKETFEMICSELSSVVAKENTTLRVAVPVKQRVAVCIWRLATGEPLRLVSKKFGLGISTCHKLVLEVCNAITNVLLPKYIRWPDEVRMRRIKDEYESISGIRNVIGSVYTTHIPIIAPKNSVAAYFNKRHTERNQKTSYSITVQGVVDPKGVFTDVCIGRPGSMSNDQVLENSSVYRNANKGLLSGNWIVGNSSYPLMDWVLVPYTHQNLTWTQHALNEKVGQIQGVAKDAFARLKGRWACLQKRTETKLLDLPAVLGACCVLHNICEVRNEGFDPANMFELVDDEVVPEVQIRSSAARIARDAIAHNLLHHNHAGTSFLS